MVQQSDIILEAIVRGRRVELQTYTVGCDGFEMRAACYHPTPIYTT
jgi:hypothetical protein